MYCCSECFTSNYLKNIINSFSNTGNCDFCFSQNVTVCSPRELVLFFQNFFDLYIPVTKGGESIEIQIESDFSGKIFSDKIHSNRKQLLHEIVADDFDQYRAIFSRKVILKHRNNQSNTNKVKPLQISWDKFAEEIKSTNRFHIQNALDLTTLRVLLERYVKHIPKGKKYYRARISDDINGYQKSEMYNPPVSKSKAGRANPLGISYLYLANDIKTALYEVRASLYDYVSVGSFRLKEDIKIINLRGDTYDPIYLAESGELEDFLIHLPFTTKLEQELSKPRRRSDKELDYLPTQYLSEFIKSIGFDGVEYQSSLYPNGYNLAIFNPEKFSCLDVFVCEVENIDLAHRKVS